MAIQNLSYIVCMIAYQNMTFLDYIIFNESN